jgi:hypothetical protein
VVVNCFVGAMVGLERSVLPVLAREDFGLASKTAILSPYNLRDLQTGC